MLIDPAERGALVDGEGVRLLDNVALAAIVDLDPPDRDVGPACLGKLGVPTEQKEGARRRGYAIVAVAAPHAERSVDVRRVDDIAEIGLILLDEVQDWMTGIVMLNMARSRLVSICRLSASSRSARLARQLTVSLS